ncbi:MAG: DNA-directed RNA polymerase subunit alpha [Parcubacteria group bacterium]
MIQYPINSRVVPQEDNRAVFEIAPLYPGYGTTIGNVLRRVLVSSIEGSAIVSVKMKGVDHEFTTIPNVLEDVAVIIMNLKKVRFKMFKDEPITLALSVKGQKEVTAKDIKTTADIEIINQNQKIATITDKKGELELELIIERGVGYVPVEQRQKEKLTVGEIAIDAIFSPIQVVNFTVENMRVGQRTDYNKVLLEISTDGSISPEDAFKRANDILIEHFQTMNRIVDDGSSEIEEKIKAEESEEIKDKDSKKK